MSTCPYCAKATEDKSRVCKNCGRALVQRCLACAEDIPVLSPVCPLCNTAQTPPALLPVPAAPSHESRPPRPLVGWVGDERSILLTLFLWFITCGLWGLVAFYQVGSDIKAHRPRSDINPGLDILLGILTCGVWFIFAVYNYSEALKQCSQEEGGSVQDVTTLCTVLEVLKYPSAFSLGIVTTLILQNELNEHWRRHRSVS